ncbi:MAG: hypothetical protein ACRCUT_07465, partial [Spirochaetota bacterium]
ITLVPLIENIDQKTEDEIKTLLQPAAAEETADKQKAPQNVQEKIAALAAKKNISIEEIKDVYNRIDEITLYNRKVVKGAIISRGTTYQVLTVHGKVAIAEKEIKSVRVIK